MKSTKEMLRDLSKYDGDIREANELRIKMKSKKLTGAQKQRIHNAIAEEVAEMEREFGGSNSMKAYEMATQGY